MRVLHIGYNERYGGAARAAYRIHRALLKMDVESKMLVVRKESSDNNVMEVSFSDNYTFSKILSKINSRVDLLWFKLAGVQPKTMYSLNDNLAINWDKLISNTDIINLHWINGGMIDIKLFSKFNKPIVWTMHDMWPFTGGCHYASDGCDKYFTVCKNCDQLGGSSRLDLCSRVFRRKQKYYPSSMVLVSPSNWLGGEARNSSLFAQKKVHVIPNCIDTSVFSPKEKMEARKILGLPSNTKVILFGAMGATSDPRKGFQYLKKSLNVLSSNSLGELDNIELLIFGSDSSDEVFDFPVHFAGNLHDDISLTLLYSAADVMVVPSHMDNLPNTIMEALACGTPCIGFNIGGIPDMIVHGKTGYLAQAYNVEELAKYLLLILKDDVHRKEMSIMAREYVVENYAEGIVAEKYLQLYKQLMRNEGMTLDN